jgi:hypothetical protein
MALECSFEIIEPVDDPADLFAPSGARDVLLECHHVGTWVAELGPGLEDARGRGLRVTQLRVPGADIAFIDLRQLGGQYLELLCPRA